MAFCESSIDQSLAVAGAATDASCIEAARQSNGGSGVLSEGSAGTTAGCTHTAEPKTPVDIGDVEIAARVEADSAAEKSRAAPSAQGTSADSAHACADAASAQARDSQAGSAAKHTEPSVRQWHSKVHAMLNDRTVASKRVSFTLQQLANMSEVQVRGVWAQVVVLDVTGLLWHAQTDERKTTVLDALGNAAQQHAAVFGAIQTPTPLRRQVQTLFELAAADDLSYVHSMCAAQMATAQGKLQMCCSPWWQQLAPCHAAGALFNEGLHNNRARAIATVVHRAASLSVMQGVMPPPDNRLRRALHALVADGAPHMDARGLGNSSWALVRLGDPPILLMFDLLERMLQLRHLQTPQGHTVFAFAVAQLTRSPPPAQLLQMLRVLQSAAPQLSAWQAVAVMTAVVKIDTSDYAESGGSSTECSESDGEDRDTGLAEVDFAWAAAGSAQCATLAAAKAALLEDLMLAALASSHKLGARSVSNLIWAIARGECALPVRQRGQLVAAAAASAERMTAQAVANTLWGFATCHMPLTPSACASLAAALQRRALEFNGTELHQVLWAAPRLGFVAVHGQQISNGAQHHPSNTWLPHARAAADRAASRPSGGDAAGSVPWDGSAGAQNCDSRAGAAADDSADEDSSVRAAGELPYGDQPLLSDARASSAIEPTALRKSATAALLAALQHKAGELEGWQLLFALETLLRMQCTPSEELRDAICAGIISQAAHLSSKERDATYALLWKLQWDVPDDVAMALG